MKRLFLNTLFVIVFSAVTNFSFSIHEECIKNCAKKEAACKDHCDRLRGEKGKCYQHCEEESENCYFRCRSKQGLLGKHEKGSEGHEFGHEEKSRMEEHSGY